MWAGAIRSEPANKWADFMLSEETIKKLQLIIREDYQKEISLEEATKIATVVVDYFDNLSRIYHQIKTKDIKKKSNQYQGENVGEPVSDPLDAIK